MLVVGGFVPGHIGALVMHTYPAWLPSHAVHLGNGCCEKAAEGSCERRGGEEDGCSDA